MKKKIIHIILPILFALYVSKSVAQTHQIGFSMGVGSTSLTSDFNDEKNFFTNPFSHNTSSYYLVGVEYLFKIKPTILKLGTGIFYNQRTLNNAKVEIELIEQIEKMEMSYVNIPIGVDFNFGRSFNFIISSGMNFNYLIKSTVSSDITQEFISSKSDFQIGYYTAVGLSYIPKIQGGSVFEIVIKYQNNHDFTKIYNSPIQSKFGTFGKSAIKGHDGFINLKLLFYIRHSNKNLKHEKT